MKEKKKNEVEPRRKLYCSYCGTQLVETMVGAEVITKFIMIDLEYHPYSRFNTTTGKRQYVFRYRCPFNRWVFSPHDCYEEDEVVTI